MATIDFLQFIPPVESSASSIAVSQNKSLEMVKQTHQSIRLRLKAHSNYPYPMPLLAQATRARNALWLMFFVMGVVSMAWVPRIPEI